MTYVPAPDRYDAMTYRRSGRSGLQLPAISLGLWNNFGDNAHLETQRAIIRRAFDLGVTHIDLANNYGPPPGAAESNFGRILKEDLAPWRDELIISTKAGYDMWPGPYGEWGSRKYLLASPRPEPRSAWGSTTSTSSTRTGSTPTPRSRRRSAPSTPPSSRARRSTPASPPTPARAPPRRSGSSRSLGTPLLIHQPSLQPPQPLDRGGPARRAGGGGRRLHRLLAARPGHAHDQVPRRHPRELPRRRGHVPEEGLPQRGEPRPSPRAQRDREAAAASRSPRWRSPGCCATPASPPR